jgi:hypothetical protein
MRFERCHGTSSLTRQSKPTVELAARMDLIRVVSSCPFDREIPGWTINAPGGPMEWWWRRSRSTSTYLESYRRQHENITCYRLRFASHTSGIEYSNSKLSKLGPAGK